MCAKGQGMQEPSIGQCATLACILEVAAPKPGNVHRGSDFDDVGLNDFLVSAVAIGPAMEAAAESGKLIEDEELRAAGVLAQR